MTEYKRIGIDLSKTVFTLHGIDGQDGPVLRVDLRRAKVLSFFDKLPPTVVAMEACGSAHHWARSLVALGHKVLLIPPQYVKPFVKRGKNDRNDAAAICEAAGRPDMRTVPMKSVTQQAQGMVLKIRQTLIDQRTRLTNTLRGHAGEFGVVAAKGLQHVGPLLAEIARHADIPAEAGDMFALLGRQIAELDAEIATVDAKVAATHKANSVSQRLATIPGVGPLSALTLALEVDAAMFASGRHLAAWAGLTPQEHSSGGKQRMGGISRAGHERLRSLLVCGATAVIQAALKPGSKQMTGWLQGMLQRKPRKLVAVALANKMARMAWALMTHDGVYQRPAGKPVTVPATVPA